MEEHELEEYTSRLFNIDYILQEEFDKLIEELDRLSTERVILE